MNISKHLDLLGRKVTDRVTGFTGVVSTVAFDLYGCIQAAVVPSAKDGKYGDSLFFDVARLKIGSGDPVMERPDYHFGPVAAGKHGAAEKPTRRA